MPQLIQGGTFDLTIVKYLGTESFPSGQDASKIMQGHKYLLTDENLNEYPVQIIDTTPAPLYGDPGDLISVTCSKFSRGLYSVKYIKTISKAEKLNFETKTPNNPLVRGTAAEVAMTLAIEHFKYKEEDDKMDMFKKADEIFNWLKRKA